MTEVDVTNKEYLPEIVAQRQSASLFLNFRPETLSEKRLQYDCFSVNFVKFIKIAFL